MNITHSCDTVKNHSAGPLPPILSGGSGPDSLPCLYSNNSIQHSQASETKEQDRLEVVANLTNVLTPYHKRQAHTLYSNVERLVKISKSIGHLAFFTLTFPDNVTDHKEAYKRFRSFNSNFLASHAGFGQWVCVKERQKRGAWHYHMIIQVSQDIREGVKFEELEKNIYTSASPYLRDLWAQLRTSLLNYGLGRAELVPIKSNAEAIGRYVGKYISKHMYSREEEDKGVRLVSYSRGWTKNSVNFAWNTPNATNWRRCLAEFARQHGCTEMYQLTDKLGPGWAYRYAEDIIRCPVNLLENLPEPKPYRDRTVKRITDNKRILSEYRLQKLTLHSPKKRKTHSVLIDYDKDYITTWTAAHSPGPEPDNLDYALSEEYYQKVNVNLSHEVELQSSKTINEETPF